MIGLGSMGSGNVREEKVGKIKAQSPAGDAGNGVKADADFAMGGQAVIEGVMMRGPQSYAVAVRKPQGGIVMRSHSFIPVVKRRKWLALPVVRGAVSLIEMMLLGYRTLEYSANVAERGAQEMEADEAAAANGTDAADNGNKAPDEKHGRDARATSKTSTGAPDDGVKDAGTSPGEEPTIPAWQMAVMFLVSMGFGMLLFVALPNYATMLSGLEEIDSPVLYNLISGAVRVLVIVGYIWGISLMPDVRRLFQYHGAEHKVVMAHEKKLPLELEAIRPMTTLHPRCGTTFIAVVILVSIVIFSLLAALIVEVYPGFRDWSVWARKPAIILLHIVFMPLVAGLAYEVTRRAGRRPDFWLYRLLLAPGFAFQKITTREPDDSMIEVALTAFLEALEPQFLGEEVEVPVAVPVEADEDMAARQMAGIGVNEG
ncbi:MAG TPA: DUF1385 domain-containing protein [Candidatus Sumerlaeota bacterium]|nr:DUF1385 domain-containing protein [Candidatus Sumerlaeota bacterium]HPS02390.1 DUF1385 domain-containing protein [Candidatus Sumerlaeota bacterium]